MNNARRDTSVGPAIFPILVLVWLLAAGAGVSRAADCKALAEVITNEHTLLTRKNLIEEAIKVCPKDAEIVYLQGYSWERLRKYDAALRSYKRAIALDSGNAKAHFSIGDIQMIMKNYQGAAEAYATGLQYDPGDARAKGSLLEARKMYQETTGKSLVVASRGQVEKAPEPKPESKPETKPEPKHEAKAEAKPEPKVEAKNESWPIQLVAPILRLQVPFAIADAELSQDSQDVLSVVVGQALRRKDMQNARFEVGGHTDNVESPSNSQELARKRAEAVQKYLMDNFGLTSDRLPIAAYGQSRPRVPNSSPANQEINRRVEFAKVN